MRSRRLIAENLSCDASLAVDWLVPHLRLLQTLVVATIDENGSLLDANRGFLRIIAAETLVPQAQGMPVAEYFIQPNFLTLRCNTADSAGLVHEGLLTIGPFTGQNRTLLARVWRVGNVLHVLAEYDLLELEQNWHALIELNQNYALAQAQLAQGNLKLRQSEAELKQLVRELEIANQERKQAEDQLQLTQRLASIGALAAGMAHEINNPLGYISSNFATLSEYARSLIRIIDAYATVENNAEADVRTNADVFSAVRDLKEKEGLQYIRGDLENLLVDSREGLGRVNQVVEALWSYSHSAAAESWQENDINGCIESALHSLAGKLTQCEIRKELGALPPVECLLSQIELVFMNLLLNAVQATDGNGEIRVRTGMQDSEVWIEVKDTGRGIAPEHLPHIYDPFFTTKRVGQGRGIGLWVAYGILKHHSGSIEVSNTCDAGTTFVVRLPIRQACMIAKSN